MQPNSGAIQNWQTTASNVSQAPGKGSKIGAGIGAAGGMMIGGPGGAAIGSSLGSMVGGLFDKPDGIPAPLTGAEAGLQQKQFMDAAYGTETTPWERLGVSQGPSSQQAVLMDAKVKQRNIDKELQNQKQIAEANNRATIISSMGQFGPQGIEYGLGKYSTSVGSKDGFDTAIAQSRERNPAEIQSKRYGSFSPIKSVADDFLKVFGLNGNRKPPVLPKDHWFRSVPRWVPGTPQRGAQGKY